MTLTVQQHGEGWANLKVYSSEMFLIEYATFEDEPRFQLTLLDANGDAKTADGAIATYIYSAIRHRLLVS